MNKAEHNTVLGISFRKKNSNRMTFTLKTKQISLHVIEKSFIFRRRSRSNISGIWIWKYVRSLCIHIKTTNWKWHPISSYQVNLFLFIIQHFRILFLKKQTHSSWTWFFPLRLFYQFSKFIHSPTSSSHKCPEFIIDSM
jgi:hypothetical protein